MLPAVPTQIALCCSHVARVCRHISERNVSVNMNTHEALSVGAVSAGKLMEDNG